MSDSETARHHVSGSFRPNKHFIRTHFLPPPNATVLSHTRRPPCVRENPPTTCYSYAKGLVPVVHSLLRADDQIHLDPLFPHQRCPGSRRATGATSVNKTALYYLCSVTPVSANRVGIAGTTCWSAEGKKTEPDLLALTLPVCWLNGGATLPGE